MFELVGTLHRVDEITNQDTADGKIFSYRIFLIKYVDLYNREQFVKFNLEKPLNLNEIEKFEIGQEIKVKFYLYGSELRNKYGPGTVLFEKKKVLSIDTPEKNTKEKTNNPQTNNIQTRKPPIQSYIGPDLTQDFSEFSDTLSF